MPAGTARQVDCPPSSATPTFRSVNSTPVPDPAAPRSSPLEAVARLRGLVALAAAAAFVRLHDLSDWWLNPDEGIYYSILTRADFGGFWQEVTANAHPPLYYLILRGMGAFTWDFLWFRAFSVACGVLALAGVWAVARRLAEGGVRSVVAGLVAGLVLAFAPGAVELSQVMRPYMLQLALLSWALFFFLRHQASESGRDLAAYLVLLVLALLTHYSSVLALGVFLLAVAARAMERGLGDDAWRRLAASHALPLLVVGLLFLLHLRPLADSALADDALDGWLSFYMIDGPPDVWWSFLGFHHLLAGPWLRGPMVLLLLAGLGLALAQRRRGIVVLAGGAVLVAVLGAAAGLYPFGSTRHSMWLLAFVVPVLGWVGARALDVPPDRSRIAWLGAPVLLVLLGGPVGTVLGMERAPWAPADRVLRQDDLGTVVGALDPRAEPDLIVMSAQTFYLLTPFYAADREGATYSTDSTAFHFPYGRRHVLVSTAWDFSVSDPGAPEPPPPGDLEPFLATAEESFPDLAVTERNRAVILVGGWRPPFVDRLGAASSRHPFIRSVLNVPGLYAFDVDPGEMMEALDGLRPANRASRTSLRLDAGSAYH